jgi:hypothetical protein
MLKEVGRKGGYADMVMISTNTSHLDRAEIIVMFKPSEGRVKTLTLVALRA